MQGRGRYEWVDGKVYEGEWDKDEMHGSGVYILPEGRKYVGEFERGKKQGQGKMEEAEGVYVGSWKAGLKEGKGKFTYQDGREELGIWRNNVMVETISTPSNRENVRELPIHEESKQVEKPLKQGTLGSRQAQLGVEPKQREFAPVSEEIKAIKPVPPLSKPTASLDTQSSVPISPATVTTPLPKPNPVKSDPKPSQTHSLASATHSSPIAFTGISARGEIESISEAKRLKILQNMAFPSEFILTEFASGVALRKWETLGAFSYSSLPSTANSLFSSALLLNPSSLYKGETTPNRVRNGRGMTLSQGSILEGEWVEDQLHGVGRAIESDGDVYVGYWDRGLKHGFGVLKSARGVVYAGEWVSGEQIGLGYEHGGLITYKGHFHKGYKQGHGRLEISKEGVYEGNFQQDLREGYGTMVFLDGKKYAGEWHEDRMEGKGVKMPAALRDVAAGRRTEISPREEAERLTFNPNARLQIQDRVYEDQGRFTVRPKTPVGKNGLR